MLLEFRVANFRSIRDEQTLSLVALEKDTQHEDANVLSTGNPQVPQVLADAALYGPNASGKTNLILAMGFFQAMVRDSAASVQPGQPLNVQAFAFDPEFSGQPSSFEAAFILDGVRYQYGFTATPDRIHDEWLLVYKAAKPQEWFTRSWSAETGEQEIGFSKTYFSGNKDIWKKSTRPNALFLSTAVLLNSDLLTPVWNWIVNRWVVIQANSPLIIGKSIEYFESALTRELVLDFMNSADFGIEAISIKREKVKQQGFQMDFASGQGKILEPVEVEQALPLFLHRGAKGQATMSITDESAGTQKHFALAGVVLHVLRSGSVLVADELENSLHPLLVRHIIGFFQSREHNPLGAQLVFTTHNTSLMTSELFRRDQIWFTEKGTDLATVLFSLLDFGGVRPTEVYEKRYLEGRYGAIPILNELSVQAVSSDGQQKGQQEGQEPWESGTSRRPSSCISSHLDRLRREGDRASVLRGPAAAAETDDGPLSDRPIGLGSPARQGGRLRGTLGENFGLGRSVVCF